MSPKIYKYTTGIAQLQPNSTFTVNCKNKVPTDKASAVYSPPQLCPSVLSHCWLGGRKGIQLVKNGGMVEVGTG